MVWLSCIISSSCSVFLAHTQTSLSKGLVMFGHKYASPNRCVGSNLIFASFFLITWSILHGASGTLVPFHISPCTEKQAGFLTVQMQQKLELQPSAGSGTRAAMGQAQPLGQGGLCAGAAPTWLRLLCSDTCACQTSALSSCFPTSFKSLWNKAWKFSNRETNGT